MSAVWRAHHRVPRSCSKQREAASHAGEPKQMFVRKRTLIDLMKEQSTIYHADKVAGRGSNDWRGFLNQTHTD